jgi:hypothetical protein
VSKGNDGDVASARSKIAAILAGNATLANGDPAVSIIGLPGTVAHFNNQKISHAERLASVDSFISGIRGLLAAK